VRRVVVHYAVAYGMPTYSVRELTYTAQPRALGLFGRSPDLRDGVQL
jgi:hypothetical protein